MTFKYSNFHGFVLVAAVAMLAIYVTFFSPSRSGLELDADSHQSTAQELTGSVPEEMQSLKTLYRTINLVQKRYIDATRIDARQMFVASMRSVQSQVAKVLVAETKDTLTMRLDTKKKVFALKDIKTPWILLQRVKEVFEFLQEGVNDEEVDLKEVEYAAINGMLQTLDPHSVFLDPDHYRDMKDKTQGKFGGLGIVISIRDGVLTIISPLSGTPADSAGLKAGDQIIKIGEVSTVNMALNDAVGFLRGDPGTAVVVHILRKGWEEPRPFEIVRAIVKVESIESHLLPGQVGYVQIKDFQSNTPKDLLTRLNKWKKQKIKGLVLDLRGCPGGLLEAAIRLADCFLKEGVIVTTAGQGPTERDVRRASDSGEEPTYPVVVLVNRGSASASEIVAGALKAHGRGLLVGERTFGKGSVQVLYDFHDGSALKLTTAQYLTPGDVSIQSVGVIPQVELLPMRADKEMLDLEVVEGYRESDLNHHFERAGKTSHLARSEKRLNYLVVVPEKPDGEKQDESQKEIPKKDEKFRSDFAVDLARDLIVRMAHQRVEKVDVKKLFSTLEAKATKEGQKLVSALNRLGIDWRVGHDTGEKNLKAAAQLTLAGSLEAGKESTLILTITNNGPGTYYQLLATSRSDFRPLDDRELAFGKLQPGETVARELTFKVPRDALNRIDDVLWSFSDHQGKTGSPIALRFGVKALNRPRFAYSFQVVDQEGGNGDSRLQPGESVKIVVDVKNVGQGTALNTYVTLKGLSGKNLFMVRGREALKEIKPGEQRQGVFTFEIKPGFDKKEARFELGLADVDLRVYSQEKISIPISAPLKVDDLSAVVTASKGPVEVYAEPELKTKVKARLSKGQAVDAEAHTQHFYRVRLDKESIGWVAKSAVVADDGGESRPVELVVNAPPKINIEKIDLVVQSSKVTIRGKAVDESNVRDIHIFVGNDKVFFKPNSDPSNPKDLSFEAELPLKNGLNYIAVVAEETAKLYSREDIMIRRDNPDGMSYLLAHTLHGDPEPLGVVPLVPAAPE